MFSVEGKKTLITGAGRGIGNALANGFVNNGADVGIFDYNIEEDLSKKIKKYNVDLNDDVKLENVFCDFINHFCSIDILINAAGVTLPSPSEDYPPMDWDKTLSINLRAIFLLCKITGKQMINQGTGGSIINFTSMGGTQGFPDNPAYCASKGGVRQLTKALAYDWGKYGIRVNNLAPGYTHTPMNQKSWDDDKLHHQRANHTMLGRWAEPDDMLGPTIFLASDASCYITGSDLYVDGGWIAKGI